MTLTKYLSCSRYSCRHIMSLKRLRTCDSIPFIYWQGRYYYDFHLRDEESNDESTVTCLKWIIHSFIHSYNKYLLCKTLRVEPGRSNLETSGVTRPWLTYPSSLHWSNWKWEGRWGLEPVRSSLSRLGRPAAGTKRSACYWRALAAPESRLSLVLPTAASLVGWVSV